MNYACPLDHPVGVDVYEVYTAENWQKTAGVKAYGWGGAYIGATTGTLIAGAGGQAGPQILTPEEAVTVPLGAIIGGLIGYSVGIETGELMYEWAVTPGVTIGDNFAPQDPVVGPDAFRPRESFVIPRFTDTEAAVRHTNDVLDRALFEEYGRSFTERQALKDIIIARLLQNALKSSRPEDIDPISFELFVSRLYSEYSRNPVFADEGVIAYKELVRHIRMSAGPMGPIEDPRYYAWESVAKRDLYYRLMAAQWIFRFGTPQRALEVFKNTPVIEELP